MSGFHTQTARSSAQTKPPPVCLNFGVWDDRSWRFPGSFRRSFSSEQGVAQKTQSEHCALLFILAFYEPRCQFSTSWLSFWLAFETHLQWCERLRSRPIFLGNSVLFGNRPWAKPIGQPIRSTMLEGGQLQPEISATAHERAGSLIVRRVQGRQTPFTIICSKRDDIGTDSSICAEDMRLSQQTPKSVKKKP